MDASTTSAVIEAVSAPISTLHADKPATDTTTSFII